MKYSKKKTSYTVGGLSNNGCMGWFNRGLFNEGHWSNYVECKTYAHALRQFARTPGKYAQIDARGGGKPSRVVKWRDKLPRSFLK